MNSINESPHVGKQHVAESADFIMLTPSNRLDREVTNSFTGQTSAETTNLQLPLPGRPWGYPATKCPSVERGCLDEKTCTVEKKPSPEKRGMRTKIHVAKKYYVMLKTPLTEKIVLEDYNCVNEETSAARKRSSAKKHHSNKQLSGKRHHFSEKSHSFKKHVSAEKDLPKHRGCFNKKRWLTEKFRSAEEVVLGQRGFYGERGHPIERGQPAKNDLSIKKSTSSWKFYWDARRPSWENHYPQEKLRSAKKFSCTERHRQIEGDRSVKRGLSTGKDHLVGRGQPAKNSHLAEKAYSAIKSRSAGRSHSITSRPAEPGWSVDWVNLAWKRLLAGENIPTWVGRCIQRCPIVEGCLLERGYTVEKRRSSGKDHPTWKSRPQKKNSPAEEGQSTDRGHSAWKNSPTGRDRLPKKSHCAEKYLSAERSCPLQKSHHAEKGPSSKRIHYSGKVHSGERGHSAKKKRHHSAKKGSTEKKFCSGERAEFQDSYTGEESNTGENACSVEKGHHSMKKCFRVEKHSSGSMYSVPVPEHVKNTPESSMGSAASQVTQVSHQNVAGAVTTGQPMQAANMRMEVELKLPRVLKACLVEDWDLVNKQKQLFQLPAEKNVDYILTNYVTFMKSQGKSDNREYSVDELVYGIREYFNKMLVTQLLCQFEKPQYAEILHVYPNVPMSQIYGAPHLLRLFVNIGPALAYLSLNSHSLMSVSSYMHGFLNYLAENSTSLFSASNYKVASVAYCFKAL